MYRLAPRESQVYKNYQREVSRLSSLSFERVKQIYSGLASSINRRLKQAEGTRGSAAQKEARRVYKESDTYRVLRESGERLRLSEFIGGYSRALLESEIKNMMRDIRYDFSISEVMETNEQYSENFASAMRYFMENHSYSPDEIRHYQNAFNRYFWESPELFKSAVWKALENIKNGELSIGSDEVVRYIVEERESGRSMAAILADLQQKADAYDAAIIAAKRRKAWKW